MNLGEFINATFTNIGLPVDDELLKSVVTKAAVIEIPDDLVSKHNSSYLTMEAAKNNPALLKHFYGSAMGNIDSAIVKMAKEFEMDDVSKAEIDLEKSTFKKLDVFARKIKELQEQKPGATKKEKEELNAKIEEYNNEIKNIKSLHLNEVDGLKTSHEKEIVDLYMSQFLSAQNYASPLAKEEDFLLPKSKINAAISDRKLKLSRDGKNFRLMTDQGTDVFENNTKVDFKTFAEKVLADSKMTTVSTPPQPGNDPIKTPSGVDSKKLKGNAEFEKLIAEAEGIK